MSLSGRVFTSRAHTDHSKRLVKKILRYLHSISWDNTRIFYTIYIYIYIWTCWSKVHTKYTYKNSIAKTIRVTPSTVKMQDKVLLPALYSFSDLGLYTFICCTQTKPKTILSILNIFVLTTVVEIIVERTYILNNVSTELLKFISIGQTPSHSATEIIS